VAVAVSLLATLSLAAAPAPAAAAGKSAAARAALHQAMSEGRIARASDGKFASVRRADGSLTPAGARAVLAQNLTNERLTRTSDGRFAAVMRPEPNAILAIAESRGIQFRDASGRFLPRTYVTRAFEHMREHNPRLYTQITGRGPDGAFASRGAEKFWTWATDASMKRLHEFFSGQTLRDAKTGEFVTPVYAAADEAK